MNSAKPSNPDFSSEAPSYQWAFWALVVLVGCTVLIVGLLAKSFAERQIGHDASHLLTTHHQSITSTIERLRHLPISAARDKDLIALLETANLGQHDQVALLAGPTNVYLEMIANSANASIFYVIDVAGNTVASSNWQRPNSLVGKNYSFRPYFTDAIKGKEANYFAIGTSTNEAGYYYAHPVINRQGIIGIVVVKTELESLQTQWAKNSDSLILFDEHGVSVLASDERWRFKTLPTTLPKNIAQLREEYKYAGQQLTSLVSDGFSIDTKLRLNDTNYIITKRDMDKQGWQLWHLIPSRRVNATTSLAILGYLLMIGLSLALFLYRRENIRKNKLTSAAKDADNMRQLNQQLEAEIADRIHAQNELNAAQAELIQASKLTALGKMSAAIVHEVNQPLAAMRTFGASAKLLLDRGNTVAVKKNLDEISSLTERLATITTDLKMFARKPNNALDQICMQDCIRSALVLVNQTLQDSDVQVYQDVPSSPVYVLGSSIRLEQVITNLLTNAVDATKSRAHGREINLHLFVDEAEGESVLRVIDNGSGIDTHTIKHLFDPFFTTKPTGEGVGLGLAISYGIVQEMGGVIRVRNNEDAGALFSLRLKAVIGDDKNNHPHYPQ